MAQRCLLLALAGAAILAVGACGGDDAAEPAAARTATAPPAVSGAQRGVLATIDAVQGASRRGDTAAICDRLFTAGLRASIARAAGTGCPQAIAERFNRSLELSVERAIRVQGDEAVAVVREPGAATSRLVLRRQGNDWRIDRILPARG